MASKASEEDETYSYLSSADRFSSFMKDMNKLVGQDGSIDSIPAFLQYIETCKQTYTSVTQEATSGTTLVPFIPGSTSASSTPSTSVISSTIFAILCINKLIAYA